MITDLAFRDGDKVMAVSLVPTDYVPGELPAVSFSIIQSGNINVTQTFVVDGAEFAKLTNMLGELRDEFESR